MFCIISFCVPNYHYALIKRTNTDQ